MTSHFHNDTFLSTLARYSSSRLYFYKSMGIYSFFKFS